MYRALFTLLRPCTHAESVVLSAMGTTGSRAFARDVSILPPRAAAVPQAGRHHQLPVHGASACFSALAHAVDGFRAHPSHRIALDSARKRSKLPRAAEKQAIVRPAAKEAQAEDEYHVMAKSFLLGSTIDLERLRPRFEDVLRAHGKDYLVLAVTPRSHAATKVNQPSAHLPPEHTYFVVFRFGAVVLFQGYSASATAADQRGGRALQQVSAPPEAESLERGFENPWKATPETWRDAAAMDEGELIFLLMRPFLQAASDGILFGAEFDVSNLHESRFLHQRAFSRPVPGATANTPLMYKESVQLVVRPSQKQFIKQEPDLFAIRELDVGTLRCVAAALGQSSALDFYSSKVDTVLEQANTVNMAMATAGVFPSAKLGSHFLQRMIGYSSLIHSAVISQIGLMDKNDLAWQYDKYDRMLEMLRAEFDLEKRLKNLEAKISVVADNANCFLGIQQHQKSNFLEWLIVFLIGAEICVSLLDMYVHNVPALLYQKLLGKVAMGAGAADAPAPETSMS